LNQIPLSPRKKSQIFSTAEDSQTRVDIKIFQGERTMAADNKLLGSFSLVGIPPAPKGVPQIEVTFDINANGIVNVSAKDKATSKEQQIQIKSDGGLTKEEIDRMKDEAKKYQEQDSKRKQAAEATHKGENLIYELEKILNENKTISQSDRDEMTKAITDLRNTFNSNDAAAIERATTNLQTASTKVFYQNQQNQQQSQQQNQQQSQQTQSQEQTGENKDDFKEVK